MMAKVRNTRLKAGIKRRLLSVDECEVYTGLSCWWWRRGAYSGLVESVKISNRLMIPVSEVDRIISEGTRPRMTEASVA